ncbi:hypothetical protein FAGKG844_390008 [Frankia sp. AgKG'84/4]
MAGPVLSPAAIPGAIAFAPRGGLLAVGSADSAVHLWDVRDARHLVALIALPAGFAVEHLAFSPDGRLLAAGGQNGTTLLWSTTDPHQVAPVGRITFSNATALLPAVTSISFGPAGGELSVTLAGRVQFLVDLDTDRLYHEYCTLPESRISRAEWKRYLPGVQFRPPCCRHRSNPSASGSITSSSSSRSGRSVVTANVASAPQLAVATSKP